MNKIYLLILITLGSFTASIAQKKSGASTKEKQSKESSKSSSTDTESSGSGKSFGLGLRLGDPLGITMKGYLGGVALEFNIGRSFIWGYYDDRYYKYDYRQHPYYNYNPHYYNNKDYRLRPRAIAMQLHILKQKQIKGVEGLDFYFGAGPQLRIISYTYRYWDQYNRSYDAKYRQTGIGVDVVGGIEYTLPKTPVSFFCDLNLYMEFYEIPFWLALQGGIGGRFNF